MRELTDLFAALGRSTFRSRFRLGPREQAYLAERGLEAVMSHARRFILERLSCASPINDGRQTPMRGHPVFIAQHATATCCRECLDKWHRIPAGKALTEEEINHVLAVLRHWLEAQARQTQEGTDPPPAGTLWG